VRLSGILCKVGTIDVRREAAPRSDPALSIEGEIIPAGVVLPNDHSVVAIVELHRKRCCSRIDTIGYSIQIGLFLIAMKDSVGKHGEWLPMLKATTETVEGFPSFEQARKDMTVGRIWRKMRGAATQFDPALLDEGRDAAAHPIRRHLQSSSKRRLPLGQALDPNSFLLFRLKVRLYTMLYNYDTLF
jgi:hypothetical protein